MTSCASIENSGRPRALVPKPGWPKGKLPNPRPLRWTIVLLPRDAATERVLLVLLELAEAEVVRV